MTCAFPILAALPHIHPAQVMLGLVVAVASIALLAEKSRIPYPILLVLGGFILGFVPGLPRITIDPEIVFLIFLPPLLFYGGLLTTWRDFLRDIRPIALLAVGLVLVTTGAVAFAGNWFVPGLSLGMAVVLGAIVSPPDAVAATAMLEHLRVPKRVVTILEGESLVNDATALVAYQFAVAAVVSGTFSLPAASLQFIWLTVAGIGVGIAAAHVAAFLRSRITDPSVEGTVSLLTPFAAYLPAEWIHGSGVLAAVAAGIYMSRKMPQALSARARLRSFAVWETLVFLLNGIIFVLIGLQLPTIMERLQKHNLDLISLGIYGIVVSLAAVIVRLIYVFTCSYLPRNFIPVLRKEPAPPWRNVAVIGWTGMRGIVSLAAALALPIGIGGDDGKQRDVVIFLAFSVILFTLVIQGLSLPLLIKLLRFDDEEDDRKEEHEARIEAAHAALSRLQVLELDDEIDPALVERVRGRYAERIVRLGDRRQKAAVDAATAHRDAQLAGIYRESLVAERRMLTLLRDQNVIGDAILRKLLYELDLEESRFASV